MGTEFQISDDLNKWQHFVAVYSDEGLDGNSTLRAKLYLNGELKKEETVSPTTRVISQDIIQITQNR